MPHGTKRPLSLKSRAAFGVAVVDVVGEEWDDEFVFLVFLLDGLDVLGSESGVLVVVVGGTYRSRLRNFLGSFFGGCLVVVVDGLGVEGGEHVTSEQLFINRVPIKSARQRPVVLLCGFPEEGEELVKCVGGKSDSHGGRHVRVELVASVCVVCLFQYLGFDAY